MKYSVLTDIGRTRTKNQDSAFATEERVGILPNLFIVADGMGGYHAGEYASQRTIEIVCDAIRLGSVSAQPAELLTDGIVRANEQIRAEAAVDEDKSGMGTTIVGVSVFDGRILVANVGDSRAYLLHDGNLMQITRDHSVVSEMVRKGEISAADAWNHPKRNLITRAVGAEDTIQVDFFDEEVVRGDRILLCSDGLTSMLRDEEIRKILIDDNALDATTQSLVDAANAAGGADNITALVIDPFA